MTITDGLARYLVAMYRLKTDATEFGSSAVAEGGLSKVTASSAAQDMPMNRFINKRFTRDMQLLRWKE
jgi:hypothetical protein